MLMNPSDFIAEKITFHLSFHRYIRLGFLLSTDLMLAGICKAVNVKSMVLQLKLKEVSFLCVCAFFIFISYGSFYGKFSNIAAEAQPPEVMNNFRAVFVTTPNIEVAKKIAHGLVSNKLAACVNIIPQITSVYEWEGKINEDSELLLMIKTQSDKVDQIDKFVRENHPYSVPEVIGVPIDQGSEKYLQWIKETIGGTSSS